MPRYINNTGEYAHPLGHERVAAGGEITTAEYLQDQKTLTLIEHILPESCGKKLYSAAPGGSAINFLNLWDEIEVVNATDDYIYLTPNNDTNNAWVVPAGGIRYISNRNPRTWFKMEISGSGSGIVHVMGNSHG